MDDALLTDVIERLDEADVDGEVEALVLAACTDDLDQVIDGLDVAPPRRSARDPVEPPGVFLGSVTVQGFRGVGERRTLPLRPGPGLTLVVGRNGSGKSSFAEAVELVLTGTSRRWQDRPAAWQQGWRNLHVTGSTSLHVEVHVEGLAGSTVLRRDWAAGAALGDATTVVRRPDADDAPLSALGWDPLVQTYRPLLSYDELGSLLSQGPSRAFDAMNAVLGIDDLTDAVERLRAQRLADGRTITDVDERSSRLQASLAGLDDERAQQALAALVGTEPDLDALDRVLVADEMAAERGGELDVLRGLTALSVPTTQAVEEVRAQLVAAMSAVEAVEGTDADEADALATTIEQALRLHARHGDRRCPVCQEGRLDARWRDTAQEQVATLRRASRAASAAAEALAAAVRTARRLCAPPPVVLDSAALVGIDAAAASTAWRRWADAPADAAALVAHLDLLGPLRDAVQPVRDRARDELTRRNAEWAPVARQLAQWTSDARDARRLVARSASVAAAEAWLKQAVVEIRDLRFEPVARQARALWELMRRDSNVELEDVVLAGGAGRRRLELSVTVDGSDAGALGVMSQGELHALALSLFLPRATLPQSPFRFVVIDDPVQSMDPTRVEGLARVLEQIAARRQVVVFTHDDRLPEAARRLGIDAHVLGVTRRPGSRVEVREELGPVDRYLDDARALARSSDVDDRLRAAVVPGLCRAAVEAACCEAVLRRRLQAGAVHADVIDTLDAARTTNTMMALALFDDADAGGRVLGRLGAWGRDLCDAYQWARAGAHVGSPSGEQARRIEDVAALAARIRGLP